MCQSEWAAGGGASRAHSPASRNWSIRSHREWLRLRQGQSRPRLATPRISLLAAAASRERAARPSSFQCNNFLASCGAPERQTRARTTAAPAEARQRQQDGGGPGQRRAAPVAPTCLLLVSDDWGLRASSNGRSEFGASLARSPAPPCVPRHRREPACVLHSWDIAGGSVAGPARRCSSALRGTLPPLAWHTPSHRRPQHGLSQARE